MNRGRNFLAVALVVFLLGGSLGCGTINLLRLKYEGYKLGDSGHYPEAAAKLEKGLEQTKTSRIKINILDFHKRIAAGFLGNLVWVYSSMGQYDRALDYNKQALAILRETKIRRLEAAQLTIRGGLYLGLGQNDRALEYYQQALAINRDAKDCFVEGSLLSSLGWLYYRMGQNDRAREYYEQALAVHRAVCLQPFNRPFELRNRNAEAGDLNGLGCIYMDLGQYDQAREYFQQAVAINRKIQNRASEGVNLNNLGIIYRHLGQYDQARQALEEGMKVAHEVGSPENIWRPQAELGALEAKLGDPVRAIQYYRQSLDKPADHQN